MADALPSFCAWTSVLDKTTISYANLFGIQADTDMKGNDFAWLGSAFYVRYIFHDRLLLARLLITFLSLYDTFCDSSGTYSGNRSPLTCSFACRSSCI